MLSGEPKTTIPISVVSTMNWGEDQSYKKQEEKGIRRTLFLTRDERHAKVMPSPNGGPIGLRSGIGPSTLSIHSSPSGPYTVM